MASPNFTINGSATPPETAVTYGSTVAFALTSTSGVNSIVWSIVGTSGPSVAIPTITASGSPLGATASAVVEADPLDGRGVSYLLQCVINGGRDSANQVDPSLTKTAVFGVPNTAGIVPFSVGEKAERSATHGWTLAINAAMAKGGTVLTFATAALRRAAVLPSTAAGNTFALQTDTSTPTLWAVLSVSAGVGTWTRIDTGAESLVVDFSTLFTTPYQFMQADLGLTYGTTPRATSGNTSATVITLGGTTPTTPVPVTVKATNTATVGSGATFSVSFDGGSTFPLTGLTLNATPTALTGAGAGLTLAASVASSVTNDTWKATAASNADRSGNSLPYSASGSAQPIVVAGSNGHIGLLFDGVANIYISSFTAVAGMQMWMIVQQPSVNNNSRIVGSGALSGQEIYNSGTGPNLSANNGIDLISGAFGSAISRIHAVFNTTSSQIKAGSSSLVSGTTGTVGLSSGRCIGAARSGTPLAFANIVVYALGYFPPATVTSQDAAANTYWGGVAT